MPPATHEFHTVTREFSCFPH